MIWLGVSLDGEGGGGHTLRLTVALHQDAAQGGPQESHDVPLERSRAGDDEPDIATNLPSHPPEDQAVP